MKQFLFAITALVAAMLPVRAQQLTDYTLDLKQFTQLKVGDGVNVEYIQDAANNGKVTFSAMPDQASVLMFSNEKGKLTINIATEGINYKNMPTVTVRSSFLEKIENAGDSTVKVTSLAACPRLQGTVIGNGRLILHNIDATNVDLSLKSGNGTIVATGKAQELKINMTGTGTIQADGLQANTVSCRATGTGAIGCYPLELLKVFGLGSTSIYYKGSPQVNNRSVGLKVNPLDAK